jgi:hypothetical protein
MMVPDFPLNIEAGTSFDHTLQWLGGGKFIAPIEDLEVGYPTKIKVTGHQLNAVSPSPMYISGVNALDEDGNPREMRNINSKFNDVANATRVDDDWMTIPMATVNETWEEGSGEIAHFLPSNIDGWGGECNIRKNWFSPVLHTISTVLTTMTLNGTDGSIQLQIASNVTGTIDLVSGVYDIDLWPGGGARPTDGSTITRVFRGPVFVHRDS